MSHGVPTPEHLELEFRKHYLVTGNVAGSAKAAGINIRTGYDLAKRANEDAEFTEARAAIRERALADAEVMMLAGMQLALERMNKEPLDAAALMALGAGKVHIQDSGPAYGKVVVDGYKALSMNRKGADTAANDKPVEVHVHLKPSPTTGEEPGGDGGG